MKLTKIRIMGAIALLWGGGVLISALFRTLAENSAYASGQIAGFVLGGILFAVGLRCVIKG
jgi:hypothetical protein